MKLIVSSSILILLFLFINGCYHAQVTTGLEPSANVYEQTFASAWIFGLVPPDVIRAQDECANGVARVETRLSFVNMLVGNLTFGIYTPMHIKVTCAASSSSLLYNELDMVKLAKPGSEEEMQHAFANAVEKSFTNGHPVYIDFR